MNSDFGTAILAFLLLYLLLLVVSLILAVLDVIAMWKLFEKAGEKGWTALIPVYNYFQMTKIATGNYTLSWVYLAVSGAYTMMTMISSIIMKFSDNNGGFVSLVFMMFLLAIILALAVLAGYISFMFSKAYNKPLIWNICMIFLSPILIIVMGFDKNTIYIGAGNRQNF